MKSLLKMTDHSNPNSLSNRMRNRRFAFFESLIANFERPLRIIDIGGTSAFWENRGWANQEGVEILLINLSEEEPKYPNIVSRKGDATNLAEYGDLSFDVAFSNSVIEHLFTYENQRAMAREVQRVARAHWVQTPNYWFPIEPHFQLPAWQWLPESVRVSILQKRRCGRRGPHPDPEKARESIREVRLMTKKELRVCFPASTIYAEKFMGLVKSWVVYSGFER
jgi:hypothetical protein